MGYASFSQTGCLLLIASLIALSSAHARKLSEVESQGSLKGGLKQVLDFRRFRKNIFVTKTCSADGTCIEEPSERRPRTAHLRCRSTCIGVTTCGSGRAQNCMTERDTAGNFVSICKLARCFSTIISGRSTNCCARETCERPSNPKRCRSRPGITGPPGPPTPITPTPDGEIDLGNVTIAAEFVVNDCVTIPNVTQDIYLLTDATGSMRAQIGVVRDRFQDIVDNRESEMSEEMKVAFGVGIYRDERELSGGFQNLQSLSTDPDDTRTAIGTIAASGGLDRPEAGLVALYRVATDPTIGWRTGVQRVVVIFGDAPQHEPTCVDGRMITRTEVFDALNDQDITVVSIDVRSLNAATTSFSCSGTVSGSTPGNQMIEISAQTNGESEMSTVASDITDAINRALDRLKLQFFIDVTDCERAYDIRFDIAVPKEVMRGDEVCYQETIIFKPGICDSTVSKSCEVAFTASGPLLGTQSLMTQSVSGCPI